MLGCHAHVCIIVIMEPPAGTSLIVQNDGERHTRMRAMLQPAFRADYVRSLIPVFAEVAADMTTVLLQHGEPIDIEVGCAIASSTMYISPCVARTQDLFRRLTLDVIGLAGFQYRFHAVMQSPLLAAQDDDDAYQLQDDSIDVVGALDKLLFTAMALLIQLPVPTWMVPGYALGHWMCCCFR